MKIGIYSICKNEESNFSKWFANVKDADAVFVLDTGSTDSTLKKLQEDFNQLDPVRYGYNYFGGQPFAFDVARNMALSGLNWTTREPLDYLVWVDFDETFPEGWLDTLRSTLELCKSQGKLPDSLQFNNRFGDSQSTWYQTRAHRRDAYEWRYSAHEVLMLKQPLPQEVVGQCPIEISHVQKETRNDYTQLLLASHEKYCDGRTAYYLGREYYYNQDVEQASRYLRECLFVHNGWQAERGEAARMLSRMHDGDPEFALKYLHFYLAYCNLQREPYLELSRYYYDRELWQEARHYAKQSLGITHKPSSYLVIEDESYTSYPHDLLSVIEHKLGDVNAAAYHAAMCLNYEPNNSRFQENVQFFVNEGVLKVENTNEKADD